MSLAVFSGRIQRIEQDLDRTQRDLDIANAFDGTINMTDVMVLGTRLQLLNYTINLISMEANRSIAQLRLDEQAAILAWGEINSLDAQAQALLTTLNNEEENITAIVILVDTLNQTYRRLRRNLTILDMQTNRLEQRILGIIERSNNATLQLDYVNMTLNDLSNEVQRRESDLMELYSLIRTLNSSLESFEMAAVEALNCAQELEVFSLATKARCKNVYMNHTITIKGH